MTVKSASVKGVREWERTRKCEIDR